jgi:O-methyltransferase
MRVGAARTLVRSAVGARRYVALHHKYAVYTMIPRRRFVDNLRLASGVRADGDVVECGTWKGGMIAALAEVSGRRAVLFDSFEGLPPAKPIDGLAAIEWQSNSNGATYYDNCTASELDAAEAMKLAAREYEIHKGWFEDTVPAYAARRPSIGILHLDGDWYESVLVCLRSLVSLVSTGGLVLIDDYGQWDGCTRAVHDYLAEVDATEDLQRTRSGAAYLRKR